jgi:hypothetical protein
MGRYLTLLVVTLFGIGAAGSAELTVPTKAHNRSKNPLPGIQTSEPEPTSSKTSTSAGASQIEQKMDSAKVAPDLQGPRHSLEATVR